MIPILFIAAGAYLIYDSQKPQKMAKGGIVQIGDSALVLSKNKMGVIIKIDGNKYHLRFVDGTDGIYEASDLRFMIDDEMAKGGTISGIPSDGIKSIFDSRSNINWKHRHPDRWKTYYDIWEELNLEGKYSLIKSDIIEFDKVKIKGEAIDLKSKDIDDIAFTDYRNVDKDELSKAQIVFWILFTKYAWSPNDIKKYNKSKKEVYEDGGRILENPVFTFKTNADFEWAKRDGYIDDYDIVRIEVKEKDFHIDYPAHSEEQYYEDLEKLKNRGAEIIKTYQDKGYYDIRDYYDEDDRDYEEEYPDEYADGGTIERNYVLFVDSLQDAGRLGKGGKVKFKDKVKAISENLKGRKVPKQLQKEYGKTYDKKWERDESARRIAGSQLKKMNIK